MVELLHFYIILYEFEIHCGSYSCDRDIVYDLVRYIFEVGIFYKDFMYTSRADKQQNRSDQVLEFRDVDLIYRDKMVHLFAYIQRVQH